MSRLDSLPSSLKVRVKQVMEMPPGLRGIISRGPVGEQLWTARFRLGCWELTKGPYGKAESAAKVYDGWLAHLLSPEDFPEVFNFPETAEARPLTDAQRVAMDAAKDTHHTCLAVSMQGEGVLSVSTSYYPLWAGRFGLKGTKGLVKRVPCNDAKHLAASLNSPLKAGEVTRQELMELSYHLSLMFASHPLDYLPHQHLPVHRVPKLSSWKPRPYHLQEKL